MEETLLMDEEEELKRIRDSNHKKSIIDLNRKNLSDDELDEIFCDL
ncbi:MAG: hypothetical protein ISS25_00875 [Nanoarchaeota archaeon]|nr:hypothetical protein [DPANN group archaeon]MBL7116369.1 hypothetical protein [Nanoarchaeota archaeon]